ncbi:hypothetical protein [Paenisporosarcina quisquiliarum]|uniref:hypothetical protein n=1 Tax=Paenisporosarcina quisquiliarum TaxID=365346 RepID=UPI003735AAF9
MKRFKVVIPIMVIVAILATWILGKDHSTVPLESRIFITIGGTLISGIISYFLLSNKEDQIDPKPKHK